MASRDRDERMERVRDSLTPPEPPPSPAAARLMRDMSRYRHDLDVADREAAGERGARLEPLITPAPPPEPPPTLEDLREELEGRRDFRDRYLKGELERTAPGSDSHALGQRLIEMTEEEIAELEERIRLEEN